MPIFEKKSVMPVAAEALYRWHARDGAFQRLVPPWQNIEVVRHDGTIEEGDRLVMKIRQGPVAVRWEALHTDHIPGEQFVDRQVRGPFKRWEHTHRFEPLGPNRSLLVDRVDYELPMGPVGSLFGGSKTKQVLERMFAFRHRRTREDLLRHGADVDAKTVAVTGSTGLVGTGLCAFLQTAGHRVVRLRRNRDELQPGDVYWSPAEGEIDAAELEGVDAVVHLAGEPIMGRWTQQKRRRIEDSRVQQTRLLGRTLAELSDPPEVFASASTVRYYGDRGDEVLTEESSLGEGFLAGVCRRWEKATDAAVDAGIRVIRMRIGVVLSPAGGALEAMLSSVRYGLAARLGTGDQFVPWIDIDDLVAAIAFGLDHQKLSGPVNLTAAQPIRNRELLEQIGESVTSPAVLPVPRGAMKLAMGSQAAEETVLASQRVIPERLRRAGFEFFYDEPGESIAAKLGLLQPDSDPVRSDSERDVADAVH